MTLESSKNILKHRTVRVALTKTRRIGIKSSLLALTLVVAFLLMTLAAAVAATTANDAS